MSTQMYCSKCEKPCEVISREVSEVFEVWGERTVEYFTQFTSDCCDAEFSLNTSEFKQMVDACKQVWAGLGDGVPRVTCAPRQKEAA